MIEKNELRIGNFVKLENGKEYKVEEVLQRGVCLVLSPMEFWHYREIEPIPITEEHLLRFGFQKRRNFTNPEYVSDWMDLEYSQIEGGFLLLTDQGLRIYLYIHEIQNLYFALCGKELEFKN